MFRILIKAVNDANDKIIDVEKQLSRYNNLVCDISNQMQKSGFEQAEKQMNLVMEQMLLERRSICKLAGMLDEICSIYRKGDERVFDMFEEMNQQVNRTAFWKEISFSEESLKLIHRIKI